ncbi:MAG: universal stress protein [Candidatus Scalindua sp.]|nr:universal stress protein [Candidatus Scalindua sp.]
MNILVAIDLSNTSQKVLDKAITLASALSAKVWLLHVTETGPEIGHLNLGPETVRDQAAQEFNREHQDLQKKAETLQKAGVETTPLLVQGATVEIILKKSKELNIDIIVMGSHGHGGVYHLIYGSVCEGVLQSSSCPILIVPVHDRA